MCLRPSLSKNASLLHASQPFYHIINVWRKQSHEEHHQRCKRKRMVRATDGQPHADENGAGAADGLYRRPHHRAGLSQSVPRRALFPVVRQHADYAVHDHHAGRHVHQIEHRAVNGHGRRAFHRAFPHGRQRPAGHGLHVLEPDDGHSARRGAVHHRAGCSRRHFHRDAGAGVLPSAHAEYLPARHPLRRGSRAGSDGFHSPHQGAASAQQDRHPRR